MVSPVTSQPQAAEIVPDTSEPSASFSLTLLTLVVCGPAFVWRVIRWNVEPSSLFLDEDAGIDGDDIVTIGQQGIDVDLLDLGGEAE